MSANIPANHFAARCTHAALDINFPNYGSAIVTTNEVVDSISSL